MTTALEFQRMLLTDEAARRAFAEDPKKFLADNGLELPKGLELPDTLDAEVVEADIARVNTNIEEVGASLESLDTLSASEVTDFVSATVPVINRDLDVAASVHDRMIASNQAARLEDPSARATVAVVGAVVAVVVAVPVAVFGVVAGNEDVLLPASGIRRVSRGATGLTVEGPSGLRVHGLSVNEVAELIKHTRE